MRHLRPTAIAGLLLAAATLSSCGFDYATDRPNQIGAGGNERQASVDALGIQVVSDARGQGRLIGALVNNSEEEASLVEVTAGGSETEESVEVADFDEVEVAPRGHVNLAREEQPIGLSGDFQAGDVLELTLEFSTGERSSVNAAVVKAGCFYYDDISVEQDGVTDGPTEDTSAAPTGESESHAVDEEDLHADEDSAHASEEPHGDAAYLCPSEVPTPGGHGEGGH